MKEQDKKVDRYMELLYRYHDDPNQDKIIAREMGWTWLLEEMKEMEENPSSLSEDEEIEEGESWKAAAGIDEKPFEWEGFENLPVYQLCHHFALTAMRFVDQLPESVRENSSVVDFVSNAMIAGAKIAGGAGIGDDLEELGGNIACCKRGLAAANLAIVSLREMKEKQIVGGKTYFDLMNEATEARNAIAIHILELREKFQKGISG